MKDVSYKNVPRETWEMLNNYCDELLKWNKDVNLVSRKLTRGALINEHILECMQLEMYMTDKGAKVLDVGSGGGLPGLVLCILGYSCDLSERIAKKCVFLNHILSKFKLAGSVVEGDVSEIAGKRYKYIVSRAVTSVDEIVELSQKVMNEDTIFLLHKSSEQSESEVKRLGKKWKFKLQVHKNNYKNECVILEISNLKPNF